jgi:hypothetical protein
MELTPQERQRIFEEEKARAEAKERIKSQKRTRGCLGCLGLLVVTVGLISVIGERSGSKSDETVKTASSSAPAPNPRREALAAVNLEFTWTKAGFGNIMEANFVVQNKSPYTVKDLEITCVHSGNSGTVIDRNVRTLYELVKPQTTRRFSKVSMGFIHSQAVRSNCRVTDLVASR